MSSGQTPSHDPSHMHFDATMQFEQENMTDKDDHSADVGPNTHLIRAGDDLFDDNELDMAGATLH